MIESYIKNDLKLYQSILAKASNAAYNEVEQLIKNSNLSLIFSKNPEQLRSYQTYISTAPTVRNVNLLINGVDDSIDELEGIIDDVKSGKIPNVKTVPDQLNDLYENLLSKKTDLDNFKKRGNVTDDPTSLLRTTSTLEKELTNVIFNSPESKESAISTLKKMVDDLEKSVYLRRDIQKRWGN
jgi:tetrahydromethanopterin S-methyltransferase subunit B